MVVVSCGSTRGLMAPHSDRPLYRWTRFDSSRLLQKNLAFTIRIITPMMRYHIVDGASLWYVVPSKREVSVGCMGSLELSKTPYAWAVKRVGPSVVLSSVGTAAEMTWDTWFSGKAGRPVLLHPRPTFSPTQQFVIGPNWSGRHPTTIKPSEPGMSFYYMDSRVVLEPSGRANPLSLTIRPALLVNTGLPPSGVSHGTSRAIEVKGDAHEIRGPIPRVDTSADGAILSVYDGKAGVVDAVGAPDAQAGVTVASDTQAGVTVAGGASDAQAGVVDAAGMDSKEVVSGSNPTTAVESGHADMRHAYRVMIAYVPTRGTSAWTVTKSFIIGEMCNLDLVILHGITESQCNEIVDTRSYAHMFRLATGRLFGCGVIARKSEYTFRINKWGVLPDESVVLGVVLNCTRDKEPPLALLTTTLSPGETKQSESIRQRQVAQLKPYVSALMNITPSLLLVGNLHTTPGVLKSLYDIGLSGATHLEGNMVTAVSTRCEMAYGETETKHETPSNMTPPFYIRYKNP